MVEVLEHLRRFEQGFGGDAAPVEADAAQRLALDNAHFQTQLRRPNGGYVAAGAAADHDQIKLQCHKLLRKKKCTPGPAGGPTHCGCKDSRAPAPRRYCQRNRLRRHLACRHRVRPTANAQLYSPYKARLTAQLAYGLLSPIAPMKSLFRLPLAAVGLLAFLTNCATTVTEKEKPDQYQPAHGQRPPPLGRTAAGQRPALPRCPLPPPTDRWPVPPAPIAAARPPKPPPWLRRPSASRQASAEREKEKKMTHGRLPQHAGHAEAVAESNPKNATACCSGPRPKATSSSTPRPCPTTRPPFATSATTPTPTTTAA